MELHLNRHPYRFTIKFPTQTAHKNNNRAALLHTWQSLYIPQRSTLIKIITFTFGNIMKELITKHRRKLSTKSLKQLLGLGLMIMCVEQTNAASKISPEEQRRIDANRTEASYNSDTLLIRNAELDAYLNSLVQTIIAKAPEASASNFRIHAMKNTLPYVYCLDNGAIYVSTGLLARLQNESQLVGLIAPEIASLVRQDLASKQNLLEKQYAPVRFIPNLLLIAATAGFAAVPIIDKDQTEQRALKEKLQLESDQLAFSWLQQANFDIAEAPRAAKRLLDTLTREDRFGSPVLANRLDLEARLRSLNQALPNPLPNITHIETKTFKYFSRRFAIDLAQTDRNVSNSVNFYTVLDRLESESGSDGESAFLRAEYARESMTDEARLPEVITSYQFAVKFTDVPVQAFRELAYLQRRLGNKADARRNFEIYLQKQPQAVDAPIVRSYMESL